MNEERAGTHFRQAERCAGELIRRLGGDVRIALPLGLGKPVHLINALYRRACEDPKIRLHIMTALSLEKPGGGSSLQKRLMEPFVERVFEGVPELDYAKAVSRGELPENVTVTEFFFKAGSRLGNSDQQQRVVLTNYTHVVRDLMALGVNAVGQMLAPDGEGRQVSLSCNPDLTLDILPELHKQRESGQAVVIAGELNPELPWFGNDAALDRDTFDLMLEPHNQPMRLFPVPDLPVEPADYLIGFYAANLVRDGGTLQVGIGALGSAVVYNILFRHRDNGLFNELSRRLDAQARFPELAEIGGTGRFEEGLYGCSEMMVEGFLHLYQAGILKRQVVADRVLQQLLDDGLIPDPLDITALDRLCEAGCIDNVLKARDVQWLVRFGVFDEVCELKGGRLTLGEEAVRPDLGDEQARALIEQHALRERLEGGVVMHGGFFLGPERFYQGLRELDDSQRARFDMTSVGFVNHLYDHPLGDQALKTVQRRRSRFINSIMMQTLNGAAVSDGLEDGRVVSGVGGQYNFVAMAHELPEGRSILTLRATRISAGRPESNIRFSYGHCTIPRHLRDIVVTEYGMADVRGQPDAEVYRRLICIADSRFQNELMREAKKAGKIPKEWKVPRAHRNNYPQRIAEAVAPLRDHHQLFPAFPFGTDFTEVEQGLVQALQWLRDATGSRRGLLAVLWRALRQSAPGAAERPALERMGLTQPGGWRERLEQRLVIHALRVTGVTRTQ
ncbi:acetyl-CoA hydrolase/transferase C-terminal domain-containing protein [Vreelandella utahensis]|uniref:acetyl-CoA hydrolase/transferase C-terminal domain-containing protein n=1 Tax=Vreelandella halophila TaxID=86177 RepID=UPI0009843C51|nr:acetyl-CoA hydrolase/transferase C-terminal domain-containing protein [Halomonas utahensis]